MIWYMKCLFLCPDVGPLILMTGSCPGVTPHDMCRASVYQNMLEKAYISQGSVGPMLVQTGPSFSVISLQNFHGNTKHLSPTKGLPVANTQDNKPRGKPPFTPHNVSGLPRACIRGIIINGYQPKWWGRDICQINVSNWLIKNYNLTKLEVSKLYTKH
jgi:hypothetical protein